MIIIALTDGLRAAVGIDIAAWSDDDLSAQGIPQFPRDARDDFYELVRLKIIQNDIAGRVGQANQQILVRQDVEGDNALVLGDHAAR